MCRDEQGGRRCTGKITIRALSAGVNTLPCAVCESCKISTPISAPVPEEELRDVFSARCLKEVRKL